MQQAVLETLPGNRTYFCPACISGLTMHQPFCPLLHTTQVQVSQYTPLTALRLGELALEAGVPPGVLNVLTGAVTWLVAALGSLGHGWPSGAQLVHRMICRPHCFSSSSAQCVWQPALPADPALCMQARAASAEML